MAFNDSLSDMLARIKNAHRARKSITSCYKSNLNMNVLSVLKDEGYIRDFRDLIAIENTNEYNGLYHILGGVISPMEGVTPSELNINSLIERLKLNRIDEILSGNRLYEIIDVLLAQEESDRLSQLSKAN